MDVFFHIDRYIKSRGHQGYALDTYLSPVFKAGTKCIISINADNEYYFLAVRKLPTNTKIESGIHTLIIEDTTTFQQVENYFQHVFSGTIKITVPETSTFNSQISFIRAIPTTDGRV